MESKKSKKVIIITLALVAAIAVVGAVVFIMGGKGRELKKCLDLGQKYLSEMNYEEAIAYFEKAVEIDPMSADAYIGIADAYIGMANELFDEDDLDGALEELANAKSSLENGIETLTKYAKDNSGAKANKARDDVSSLEDKLAEVEAIIVEIEERRIASLPYVELQPILDAASNVWGRNWDEWNESDFRAKFNIQTYTRPSYNNGEPFEASSAWTDDNIGPQYWVRKSEKGTHLDEDAWSGAPVGPENITGSSCMGINLLESSEGCNYSFYHYILPYAECYIAGGLYDFARANAITDADSFIAYLGLEDITGESIEINTDYGLATLQITSGDTSKFVKITLADADTNPVVGEVYLSEVYKEWYGVSAYIGMGKNK